MEVSVTTPSDVFQNFQFSEKKDCDPKFMIRNEKSLFSFLDKTEQRGQTFGFDHQSPR